jgi:iduronate 2-sulfatase
MINPPGAKAGQVCPGLVELLDFYPTILDYCGVQAPHKLAGQSLRPLIQDPARPGKPAAFTLVTRGQVNYGQTVPTDRWRYTRWSDGNGELYDEFNVRKETRNLAQNARYATTIAGLQKRLDGIGPLRQAAPDSGAAAPTPP